MSQKTYIIMEEKKLIWFIVESPLKRLPNIDVGWGNGYVGVPPNHPMYGKHYDDVEVEVHGGLTFSESSKSLSHWPEAPNGDWWIFGFDTAHLYDNLNKWPKHAVESETIKLHDQLLNMWKYPEVITYEQVETEFWNALETESIDDTADAHGKFWADNFTITRKKK